ncbi:MAG: hypothetical protein IKV97_02260 [Clostridia bacterium]|nr:hypothetical protein [Clostridia bacterium]
MFKTLDADREVIENKYHKKNEEYDAFRRMEYHGYDYDEATGLDDDGIYKGLSELSAKLEGVPRPIHKAGLFEYVLDNTRIDINEHDYFIGMYIWNRPLRFHITDKWRSEVYQNAFESSGICSDLDAAGAVHGWLDFDHTVPDWDALSTLGFSGILARARECKKKLSDSGKLTRKQEDFFCGVETEYTAIIRFIDRLYKYSLTKSFAKAPAISQCLLHLRDGAPTDTYEMLQLIYIYFMLSESVDHYQVRSLGYGLDGSLYPFYKNDIESGRYTKDEISEFIGYFLMQWASIDNYWGQPMYLGGMNADGTTKVNELSYLILEIYDKLGIYNPKIQLKINGSTPKDFILKALEMIRHGTSSIVFCNDDTITKCLMANGATYEQAVDSVMSGCYEYKTKSNHGVGISCIHINALKPVSLVFDNGFDTVSGKQVGEKGAELFNITSFEDFYKEYLRQFEHITVKFIKAMAKLEAHVQDINPSIMYSATLSTCMESMTDALDCGISNVSGVLLCSIGTAVDALMTVRELVFEKKIITLEGFKAALDSNWKGYEKLRARALNLKHKYGNGDPVADSYAAAITRFCYDLLQKYTNGHGDRYAIEMHSARAFLIHGGKTKATPDGRMAGDEISKNASPTPGADRNGITALIKSATSIDATLCTTGFCLDAMLHPSAVQGADGLDAFYAVLRGYMERGGASVHFNIFSPELLIDAQNNPEKYRNLQVRVCGWNVLWNSMDKKEQDAYILRAKNIV